MATEIIIILVAAVLVLVSFWAAVGLINRKYDLSKHGFSISPGLLMWRTKRGLHFMDRIAQAKLFWRTYGTLGVILGITLMVFVAANLVLNLIILATTPSLAVAGVQLVLPGIVPGLTIIPWIIGIATVLIVHELSHGFLLRAQGLKTESVGGLLFLVIPGAFVEPNEKELARAPVLKRLRVFAAGSFSNVLFSLLCLSIILLLLVPKPGAYVFNIADGYPADNNDIDLGMRIHSIDDLEINIPDDFQKFMIQTRPGENVRVLTSDGVKFITLAQSPFYENRGFLGAGLYSAPSRWIFLNPLIILNASFGELLGNTFFHQYVYDAMIPWAAIDVLKWVFVLNLGIGLFNLLPAVPLDGGYIIRGILEKVTSKDKAIVISRALAYFLLALILANLIPGILRMI